MLMVMTDGLLAGTKHPQLGTTDAVGGRPPSIASLAAALAAIAAPAMDGGYICDLRERSEALAQETRERKEAEAILVQTQKMQSIGLLAAGVAGDFNNLKIIVFDNLDSIERRLAHFQPETVAAISRPIAVALRGARRAASLTRRLLAFSRREVLTPTVGRSEPTGKGLSDMLTRTIGETIARHLPRAARRFWRRAMAQLL